MLCYKPSGKFSLNLRWFLTCTFIQRSLPDDLTSTYPVTRNRAEKRHSSVSPVCPLVTSSAPQLGGAFIVFSTLNVNTKFTHSSTIHVVPEHQAFPMRRGGPHLCSHHRASGPHRVPPQLGTQVITCTDETLQYSTQQQAQMSYRLSIPWGRKPCSVPRVWSSEGPEELAGWDTPVIRFQLKSADGWGCRPHREPWKVHSLSGGQEPFTLADTTMSSMAMLPCLPPTTASIMNWRRDWFNYLTT